MKFVIAIASLFLFACPGLGSGSAECPEGEVPENPTWEDDVKPMFDRLCNECHSVPAQQSAPATFRLDVCETVDGFFGAKVFAERNRVRMVDSAANPMPPLDYAQQPCEADREIITRWVEQGALCPGETANNANNMNNMSNNMNNMSNNANNMGPGFTDVANILRITCTGDGCHDGVSQASGGALILTPLMTDAEVQTALEGVTTTFETPPELMDSIPRDTPMITPNDTAASAIYLRITDINTTIRMPKDLPALTIADQATITDWINAGAMYSN